MIPISGLNWLIISLIVLAFGLKFRKDYVKLKRKDTVLKYFAWMFILVGIFLFLLSLPHLVLFKSNIAHFFPKFMAWAYIGGHMFLYLSLAFTVAIPAHLYFPRLKKYIFYIYITAGIAVTILNIIFYQLIDFNSETGVTLLNVSFVTKIIVPILVMAAYLPVALILLYKKLFSVPERDKNWLWAVFFGLIIVTVGGPIHDYADTYFKSIIADIFTLIGYLIVALGVVIYKEENQIKRINY